MSSGQTIRDAWETVNDLYTIVANVDARPSNCDTSVYFITQRLRRLRKDGYIDEIAVILDMLDVGRVHLMHVGAILNETREIAEPAASMRAAFYDRAVRCLTSLGPNMLMNAEFLRSAR